jgi:hypothetical protein
VEQYTTQNLLPLVEERIDDLQRENYHIPVLMHGHRKLIAQSHDIDKAGDVFEFNETHYADGREAQVYLPCEIPFLKLKTVDELAKLRRVNAHIKNILNNENVSDKVLKQTLSLEQYADYCNSIEAPLSSSEITYADGMPSELRKYNMMLKAADFQNNKYEKMYGLKSNGKKKYKSASLTATSNKAEVLYEEALEHLGEIWSCASPAELHTLQAWMDREIDFDKGIERIVGIDCVSVPRVRGSRSGNALDSGLPKLSKRLKRKQCQLMALRDVAMDLVYVKEVEAVASHEDSAERMSKLRALLRSPFDDDLI